jgi:hypothetical protein
LTSGSDNEFTQNPPPRAEYFVQLEEAYRSGGVVVPLFVFPGISFLARRLKGYRTYNDPNMGDNFINGTGAVDIYGLVGVDTYVRMPHDGILMHLFRTRTLNFLIAQILRCEVSQRIDCMNAAQ